VSSYLAKLNINFNELKSLTLEVLKVNPDTQYKEICYNLAGLAITKKIVNNPTGNSIISGASYSLHPEDEDLVREIIWILIIERILIIGTDNNNNSWPWLKVSSYGKSIIDSNEPIPHDPDGYIKRLTNKVKDLDPVIKTYIIESLNTYNINALLSSTVTLGCASEKALLLLIDSYIKSRNAEDGVKFSKKITGKFIKFKFDEFKKVLAKEEIPKELKDGLDIMLIVAGNDNSPPKYQIG